MRKIIYFIILAQLCAPFSSLTAGNNGSNSSMFPIFDWSIKATLWKQIVKAGKMIANYTYKSPYVHGAAIGVFAAVMAKLILEELVRNQQRNQRSLLLPPQEIKIPKTPFLCLLLAAIYGTYSSHIPPKQEAPSWGEVGFSAVFAGFSLGVMQVNWSEIQEGFSDSDRQFSLTEYSKAGLKTAFLSAFAVLVSYIATQKLTESEN